MRTGLHIAFLFGVYLIVESKYQEIDDEVTKMERGMEPNEDDVHFYLFTRSVGFTFISTLFSCPRLNNNQYIFLVCQSVLFYPINGRTDLTNFFLETDNFRLKDVFCHH